mmetsp:Transcript_28761/g.48943  ORF Transcript_28761/g.48943 Transcript_28761/m.48943 type:complete len:228 (+) Transcript_28761:74-757(+)
MKLATAVISLVTIIGANGTSTASTKSSKSKASCIESKSGKSSKSGKASGLLSVCSACSFGSGIIYNTTLCGTDAGFCEFSINVTQIAVDACDANNCVPACDLLEPICELCVAGPIYGVDCPQGPDACEISFSADAEPTCVISDCVPPDDVELGCGVCSTAPESYGCPDDDVNYCQADFDVDTIVCVQCNETACPDYTFDQCGDPDETDARRLEMGDKEWSFNNVFQW